MTEPVASGRVRPATAGRGWTPWLLVSLPSLWLVALLVLPCIVLLGLAFAERSPYGEVIWNFSFDNFKRLAGFSLLGGWTADYLRIIWRTVIVAFVSTMLSLLLAYPLAFYIAARPPRQRYLWLGLIMVPFCTNLVIRTQALMLILGNQWPIAKLAQTLGWIDPGRGIYPGMIAVYIGMVSSSLPFATLPLYTNVERLDWEVVEAARDLYAGKLRVFMHAILPQTYPGLVAALILTFIPALGMFVVPDLLDAGRRALMGNIIQQQFSASRDWPFGAAVSFGLMLLTLVGMFLMRTRAKPATSV